MSFPLSNVFRLHFLHVLKPDAFLALYSDLKKARATRAETSSTKTVVGAEKDWEIKKDMAQQEPS